jgi:mannose-6-phosphate isomerase-like protein (cupin superfamily)
MNQPTSNTLKSKSVPLPSSEEKFKMLLIDQPESVCIKTGCVILLPGESIGLHSTENREEVIVPLSGTGELFVDGMEPLQVHPGCVLYNPPHTLHNVTNTGDQILKYIFIVTKAD